MQAIVAQAQVGTKMESPVRFMIDTLGTIKCSHVFSITLQNLKEVTNESQNGFR